MKYKILFMLAVMFLFSCRMLGCFTVKDACKECCKQATNKLKGPLGSEKAWRMREPCVKECVDFANERDKDGEWVEANQACYFEPSTYELD